MQLFVIKSALPVVDAFEDQTQNGEPHKSDAKLHFLFLQHDDVRVEGDAQEGDIFRDEDEIKNELAAKGGHVLKGLGVLNEQRVHPDPVVDVDVGQPIADHVVEEAEIEDASLDPVSLGVTGKQSRLINNSR